MAARNLILLVAVISAAIYAVSCEDAWDSRRPGAGTGNGEAEPPEAEDITVFNFALAEYPEGYDWLRDTEYGTVDCEIVMLDQEMKEMHRFKAGYYHDVATDIDMVRCLGGHVFTDYSTSGETVIKRDGVEIIRYAGREMMAGFIEKDGSVFTLGVSRDGTGWTYRRNGEVLASSGEGQIMNGLYMDNGSMHFGYRIDETVDYRTVRRYFAVKDGVKMELTGTGDEEIVDFRSLKGSMNVLTFNPGTGEAFLSEGYLKSALDDTRVTIRSMDFLTADDLSAHACGQVDDSGGGTRTAVWKGARLFDILGSSFKVIALHVEKNDMSAVGYYGDDIDSQFLYRNAEYIPLPEGYRLDSEGCAVFTEGHYCLCLNPSSAGLPPVFIIDGRQYEVDINGCFLGAGYNTFYLPGNGS